MARYGQPESFRVRRIVPVETPVAGPVIVPNNILQAGDTLKLRTYFEWWGTNGFERIAVNTAMGGSPTVKYYFDDLEAGGTPISVPGGGITMLAALDAQAQADLGITTYDFGMGDLYRSADTIAITTGLHGSAATLKLPSAASSAGTWQVVVMLYGGTGSKVSAFSTDMFVEVIKP